MKLARFSSCAALLAAFLLAACSRKFAAPTAPGVYTLRGHVKLTGFLVDTTGDFAGTRVVGDADGVLVELVYGDKVVARTRTVHGVYTFHGVGTGGYVVRTARIGPLLYDETNPLTIPDFDVDAADTLRLVAQGADFLVVPNPVRHDSMIYFFIGAARVDMRVVDLAGNLVRHIVNQRWFPAGTDVAGWDGTDDAGRPARDALYWLLFHAEYPGDSLGIPDDRVQLLFR
jgi:hypothetical protein